MTYLKWHTSTHDNPTDGLHSCGTPPACLHSSGSILQPTSKYGDQLPPISSHCIFPNSGVITNVATITETTTAITMAKNTDCFKDAIYSITEDKTILITFGEMNQMEQWVCFNSNYYMGAICITTQENNAVIVV